MIKTISSEKPIWWTSKITQLLELSEVHRNSIIYNVDTINENIDRLGQLDSIDGLFYAMKANYSDDILKTVVKKNIGFECVSPGEVQYLINLFPNIDPARILFTPNFSPKEDYIFALERNLVVTVDSLYPLKAWPDIFMGKKIMARIDLDVGDGHHEHVNTGGDSSKFGIPLIQISELKHLAKANNITIGGLHTHSGSGIKNASNWIDVASKLVEIASNMPLVKIINLGGGIPIRERLDDNSFDFKQLNTLLLELKIKHPRFKFWLEPGRYIIGEAGVILTKVTQLKEKGKNYYIGVGVGMNTLIRPALYGAFHEIINLSRYGLPNTQSVTIVGPVCESGDKLGINRKFPLTIEGDTILIGNTGAYVKSMASNYNLREIPKEIMI
jgi:diaminopimelate decarboxylase/aspartate kinase|tara:strand:- start:34513 stop:35667 length:1155 start_codon:yes stop_codon:yes gene_type:complete